MSSPPGAAQPQTGSSDASASLVGALPASPLERRATLRVTRTTTFVAAAPATPAGAARLKQVRTRRYTTAAAHPQPQAAARRCSPAAAATTCSSVVTLPARWVVQASPRAASPPARAPAAPSPLAAGQAASPASHASPVTAVAQATSPAAHAPRAPAAATQGVLSALLHTRLPEAVPAPPATWLRALPAGAAAAAPSPRAGAVHGADAGQHAPPPRPKVRHAVRAASPGEPRTPPRMSAAAARSPPVQVTLRRASVPSPKAELPAGSAGREEPREPAKAASAAPPGAAALAPRGPRWQDPPPELQPTSADAAPLGAGGGAHGGAICCFGDSLTVGVRGDPPSNSASESYPKFLEELLRGAGYDFTVHNAGNWGDTTGHMAVRLPKVLSQLAGQGVRVDFVLVLGGTNDVLRGEGGGPHGILARLRHLHGVASAAPSSPAVGVVTVPPARGLGQRDRTRLEVNRGLRSLCQQPRRFLVDLEALDVGLSKDGVHYTAEGCAEMASRAFRALQPMLPAPAPPAAAAVGEE